jgi:hypothetical protein
MTKILFLCFIIAIIALVKGEEDFFFQRSIEMMVHKLDTVSKTKFTNLDPLFEIPKHSKELLYHEVPEQAKAESTMEDIGEYLPQYHL